MITPPLLIFYLSIIVLLINIFKVFFNKKYSEDEVIITIVAIIYIAVYLVVYLLVNRILP